MVEGDGNAEGPTVLAVLAEIQERLSALKPEQYIVPKMEVEEGFHTVGVFNDYLQRLATLRHQVAEEHNDLVKNAAARAKEQLAGAKSLRDMASVMEAIAELSENGALQVQVEAKNDLHDVLDKLLWTEIRRAYPELGRKNIGFRAGWKVGWFEEEKDLECDIEIELAQIFGRSPKRRAFSFGDFFR